MSDVTALLSMLHEPPARNSATRAFRTKPVLRWTLDRLARCSKLAEVAIVCWEDQLPGVMPLAGDAYVLAKGPRQPIPELDSLNAARRWSDGWRGGLLSTCEFDRGFYGPWVREAAESLESKAVVLIDPAAALVDPLLIDALIGHAEAHPDEEILFTPAAPGLAGAFLRRPLLDRLAAAKTHPGRLLHYMPDQLSREPLATGACAPAPTIVARATCRLTLDSDRQIRRIADATLALNGTLISSPAEEIVRRVQSLAATDDLPREVVLELTTRRATRPIYAPGSYQSIQRPDLTVDIAARVIESIAPADDVRLTIAGVGDPLLCEQLPAILDLARAAGLRAIHVETDLCDVDPDRVKELARSPIDVLTVHVPALTAPTYERVMGRADYTAVLENVRLFVTERHTAGGGGARVPLLVPTFTKCSENVAEMEAWYDQWLRAVGCAVIRGPSEYGGIVPADVGVADMTPPKRRPCARLSSRLTVLSDGRIVSCEEDVLGRQVLGDVCRDALAEVWKGRFGEMRNRHALAQFDAAPLCAACKEWHRP